ncbi:Neural proliferation differentiation and control protein 1 [Clonorchis sinensis]|uniref:Neural proliferation differentiation and control protein 1 n=1 Tax=Clonorchis sinensis TaxID=79923 RepID=A0A3R7DIH7_CLOSI|nr:Neural proliferation differentiation and control protein 1 [Clonorchis sinensis]
MLGHGDYFYGLCVFLLTFGCLFDNSSAYLDRQDLSKRFGAALFEPDLPWLLENRNERLESDTDYSDTPWTPNFAYDSVEDPLYTELERSMELRSRRELDLTRRTLNGEAVPYGFSDEHIDPKIETIPRRVRRDDNPAVSSTPKGLRSYLVWKLVALGTLCVLLVGVVIAAAVLYFQKIRSPKRGTKGQEDEMGATFTDDRSPHGSLLGETTSLSLDGDRKLAHSAQMYHYQHQKQQMLAVERASDNAQGSEEGSGSDVEEGDFTVYECPGLAEPNQLELENPLYEGESASQVPIAPDLYGGRGDDEVEDESDSTPTAKTMDH